LVSVLTGLAGGGGLASAGAGWAAGPGGLITIAGIGGRTRGTLGAAPTSIVRVTVTAGCGGPPTVGPVTAGDDGGGGGAAAGGLAATGAGGGAGGGWTGACGRVTALRVAGAGGAPLLGSGRAAGGTGAFASPPRPSEPGLGALPSPGDRFIGGPSSPVPDVVGDEASASPFTFGKSFEKMLIRRTPRINDSPSGGIVSGAGACDRVYTARDVRAMRSRRRRQSRV
jgi:hypothetical protein